MSDSYVPDPDRDSRQLVAWFLDRLADGLASRGVPAADRDRAMRAIEAERARLQGAEGEPPDEPARYNRRYTTTVLAAYRVLGDLADDHELPTGAQLRHWLTDAFVRPFGEQIGNFTRAALDQAPDPFIAMVGYSKERERTDYGVEFEFEHSVDDGERFHTDVRRCGYHDFFVRHGTPELTPVFCAFDANWIDAIEPERDGFEFSRETTIGLGGTFCPFHFERRRQPEDTAGDADPMTG